jgi:hypothetical protein
MVTSKTPSSTPRLSEVARELVIPKGIVTTAWPRIEAKCRLLGVTFDPWQQGLGAIALGKRKDGKYATTVGGIVMSIPRQVGKTFLVGMILIAMCLLHPGYTVLWTAHHGRTTTKTFDTLKALTSRKKIKPYMLKPRSTNGEQELRFRNGSVIMFGAREQGFGRGFEEVDAEVFDEAQILSARALEDMVPAANQSRHTSGALLFFMGTPPRPGIDPGEEFTNRREKALAGKSTQMLYVEFAADPDADPNDRTQWAKANPSYPLRTPDESMERMREQLTDTESFLREALGIWPIKTGMQPVINPILWQQLKGRPPADGPVAYGVRFSAEGAGVALSAAVAVGDKRFVEVIDVGSAVSSMDGLVDWLVDRLPESDGVVIDGRGSADVLEQRLVQAGAPVRKIIRPNVSQAGAAYAGLLEHAESGRIQHAAQPGLIASIAIAGRRDIGKQGGWGYEPITASGDVKPVESIALAISGLKVRKTERKDGAERGRSTSRRTGVVM